MHLLFINACPRGESSRTLALSRVYLEALETAGNVTVTERRLSGNLTPLTADDFPGGQQRTDGDVSLARELADADGVVIAAPYWEFTFPALLHLYLERVSVPGVTFRYTETGSEGLCRGKFFRYFFTAGGPVPAEENLGCTLLRHLAGLYGMGDFKAVGARGLDVIGLDATAILEKAKADAAALGLSDRALLS
ncbi:MAG: NAD(P)H dehydrogenase [Clostridiales bacterium]|nr:NAD(P)H dehydrogenase [Clostridiales bacterium]